MAEIYEARIYSPLLVTGRLTFEAAHRCWIEPRLHDWQLVYTFQGHGKIAHRAGAFITGPGELTAFRPRVFRSYEPADSPGNWGQLWVHFEPGKTWPNIAEWPEHAPGIHRLHLPTPELRDKVFANLSEMHDVGSSVARYGERLALKLLEVALIRSQSVIPAKGEDIDPRLRRAMDTLSEKLDQPFDSAVLARTCGLSERHLFRLFKERTGESPRNYHERRRLERACLLLRETHLAVAEVAAQVGFDNPFYFSLRFRRFARKSPRAFRNGERKRS